MGLGFRCYSKKVSLCRKVSLVRFKLSPLAAGLLFCFDLILLLLTRYMGLGRLWQRLCRCPSRGNGGLF